MRRMASSRTASSPNLFSKSALSFPQKAILLSFISAGDRTRRGGRSAGMGSAAGGSTTDSGGDSEIAGKLAVLPMASDCPQIADLLCQVSVSGCPIGSRHGVAAVILNVPAVRVVRWYIACAMKRPTDDARESVQRPDTTYCYRKFHPHRRPAPFGYAVAATWGLMRLIGAVLWSRCRSQVARDTEIVFLRQQLIVLRRAVPRRARPRLADRSIFVWLYRLFRAHLRHVLADYAACTHLALNKDVPPGRPMCASGEIAAITTLGGRHHQYVRTG